MTTRLASAAALALTILTAPLPAPAQTGLSDGVVSARILPGWRTEAGTHMAGLEITLAPGWKTYWRAPGDTGIPPDFFWQHSQNVSGLRLHWPVPEVSHTNGMRSIGYSDHVVIPLEFTTPEAGRGAMIAGEVEIGVCADICIPVRLPLVAELPPEGSRSAEIVAALVDRPATAAEAGAGPLACRVTALGDGLRLEIALTLPPTGSAEEVVIEAGDPSVWVSEPVMHRDGNSLLAVADLFDMDGGSVALDRSRVRMTVLGTDRAVDLLGCD
ncbi:protein-disulfide reductase DsbD domain-containing protein [Histidinibacterium lentulum]|uniref:Thiol:disulfide interchange protein DsbD N-terminal domain-containing protein n=1 Tax=Histidinibacterium lentulum TaxID=2480588 RepID=A0A3N2R4Y5_9RHOB|nr:protein-disulfide reductase DsbD domain-containing protein [Histidinibacterium lentulum]ROU02549.1 hypothetical protein EAT49_09455 [Histidinibacterium lentulum]